MQGQFLRCITSLLKGGLYHFYEDDSRKALDESGKCICVFTSSLAVLASDNKQIGSLASVGENWKFIREGKEDFDTKISVKDYHWTNLELAECAVAELLLTEADPKLSLLGTESDIDSIDDETVYGIDED